MTTIETNVALYFNEYSKILGAEEFAKLEMTADAVISNLLNDGAPVVLTTIGDEYNYDRFHLIKRKMNNKESADLLEIIYFHLHNFTYNYPICVLWNDPLITEYIEHFEITDDEEEVRREIIHEELDKCYMEYEQAALEFLEMHCLKRKVFHFKLDENGLFEPINQPQKGFW